MGEVKSVQVKMELIKSGQGKSALVKLGQVNLVQVKLGQFEPRQVHSGQVMWNRSNWNMPSEIGTGQLKSGPVKFSLRQAKSIWNR